MPEPPMMPSTAWVMPWSWVANEAGDYPDRRIDRDAGMRGPWAARRAVDRSGPDERPYPVPPGLPDRGCPCRRRLDAVVVAPRDPAVREGQAAGAGARGRAG